MILKLAETSVLKSGPSVLYGVNLLYLRFWNVLTVVGFVIDYRIINKKFSCCHVTVQLCMSVGDNYTTVHVSNWTCLACLHLFEYKGCSRI